MAKISIASKFVLKELLFLATIFILAYLANQNIQSWLGHRAIEKTGFEHISLDAAFAKAETENKLVLVDFSAIWCATCRRLDTTVLAMPDVKEKIESSFVFTRLEYESTDRKLFEHYGISRFPTLIIMDTEGAALRQLSVTLNPEHFIQQLESGFTDLSDANNHTNSI